MVIQKIHPPISSLENLFDNYMKDYNNRMTADPTFKEYVKFQIENLQNQGRFDNAEQLATELSFKPETMDWSLYFQRNGAGENDPGERNVHSFEEYLYFLRKSGTYLGEQELVAFADLVNKPIHVYNPDRIMVDANGNPILNDLGLPKLYDICIIKPTTPTVTPPIYLYHVNGNHYELLTPKST